MSESAFHQSCERNFLFAPSVGENGVFRHILPDKIFQTQSRRVDEPHAVSRSMGFLVHKVRFLPHAKMTNDDMEAVSIR